MQLTELDLNLLTRCAKIIREEAATHERSNLPWTSEPESKRAKATFDRYKREERDLLALRNRLAGVSDVCSVGGGAGGVGTIAEGIHPAGAHGGQGNGPGTVAPPGTTGGQGTGK